MEAYLGEGALGENTVDFSQTAEPRNKHGVWKAFAIREPTLELT